MNETASENSKTGGLLGAIERLGNKLPDPAVLFILAMLLTWVVSWLLGGYEFEVPKRGGPETQEVTNQLTGAALVLPALTTPGHLMISGTRMPPS